MWGFWEGQIYAPESALWRNNWESKRAGKEYIKLVTAEWVTTGVATSNNDGSLKFHGLYGDYDFRSGEKVFRASLRPGLISTEARPITE